ncbi:HAD-IIIC family phosphatase [Vibrio splendidus]
MNIIKNKIKLVIWDLDETYWKGTLSEEGVEYIQKHHDIIIELTKRGIVNSICSKNNYEEVKRLLQSKGIWDYFVFPEISWNPKGEAIKTMISDMSLRPDNVLFIDDNLGNLNEVEFFVEGISACEPFIINNLLSSDKLSGKSNEDFSRLKQYRILEEKREVKINSSLSNYDFLKESNIRVSISKVTNANIDRVIELVERTNQLNYTKLRSSSEELKASISESEMSGVVSVKDKYGDYGISGFYMFKSGKLEHFLFSCRTMNMGVENWVYKQIGNPNLDIIGEVATKLTNNVDVSYINSLEGSDEKSNLELKNRYLIMGGCDLDQVIHYLKSSNIQTEFNFVNSKGISIHLEHTELLLQNISDEQIEVLDCYDFLNGIHNKYKMYNVDWDVLIYSPLNDYSRGLYQHKETGCVIPFDAYQIDWTDKINQKYIPEHLSNVDSRNFELISEDFSFIGAISPIDFYENLSALAKKFPEKKILILTGSEHSLENVKPWESEMDIRHKCMNQAVEKVVNVFDNLEMIDVRKFVSKSDHTDNLRHYSKHIYSKIATEIINVEGTDSLSQQGSINAAVNKVISRVKRKANIYFKWF